nr:MAG TPA: ATP-dependent Clp protease ATP-binding subunit [Caudoviricetes sp.]
MKKTRQKSPFFISERNAQCSFCQRAKAGNGSTDKISGD